MIEVLVESGSFNGMNFCLVCMVSSVTTESCPTCANLEILTRLDGPSDLSIRMPPVDVLLGLISKLFAPSYDSLLTSSS